jgi:chemotaxis protein methyltransferase CheR
MSPNAEMMKITNREFEALRDLVYDRFGINLTDRKKSMVVGRLQKMLREKGFKTFNDYYTYLVSDKTDKALSELANRITTNHTFFYREADHFKYFTEVVLPEMVAKHQARHSRDLRIWCAAASSGEEPYTILITMLEYFGHRYSEWDAGLLATDISEKALQQARRAVYDPARLQNVPKAILHRYFQSGTGGHWAISEKVKKEIVIRNFNLMQPNFPFQKPFDCIWCRNVMIYFDQPTRDQLVQRLYNVTAPGGYLFVGHSESLGRGKSSWKYIRPAVYQKVS